MTKPKPKPKMHQKPPGRKSKKGRHNISLTDEMVAWADSMAKLTFGNRTAYIEHLMLKDMEAHGITLEQLLKLSEEHRRGK